MSIVAIEEHWAPAEFLAATGAGRGLSGPVLERLADLTDARIDAMDEAGVDVQVLSLVARGLEHLPPAQAVAWARRLNDELAEGIDTHPRRLAALAALPMADPERAVDELARCADELGMVGVIVNGHSDGVYLDDPRHEPLLAEIERRGLPIYLHPSRSPEPVLRTWYGGLPEPIGSALATFGWGWHIETGTHLLRLVVAGVFDRHPRLQVVVGHMGELVPSVMPRLDVVMPGQLSGLRRPVTDYLRENVHYTFSGFTWPSAFHALRDQVGPDRILFSADYPFLPIAPSVDFLRDLDVSPSDRDAIAHGNARRLFGLGA